MIDLLRRQLDDQLEQYRKVMVERPPQGWIRSIRNALGMTQAQLAKKMDVVTQVVQKIESSEEAYTIQLETLKKVAHSLDCRLSYVLIPNHSLQETVEQQIRKKAQHIVETVSHSMTLEDQKTSSEEVDAQIKNIVEDIKRSKKLSVIWEEI